jgi:hypothetical protein
VHIGKYQQHKFPIQNGLKHEDALSPLLFNSELVYAIRRVQEKQKELKFNGRLQPLACADDVNIVGGNTDTIRKTKELY